jgi:hypothetical protein
MADAGFNPSLLVDDYEDEEWEEYTIAHHHKREIRNGAGTQVGEGWPNSAMRRSDAMYQGTTSTVS